MKRIAIVQSNYIPWKGYFDLINMVDEFVLFDDVQYTRRDWRNRNLIKTPTGLKWLTIPVVVKGKYLQKIKETRISNPKWARDHFMTLVHTYAKAPFFSRYRDVLENMYASVCSEPLLSQVNRAFIQWVCDTLEIKTRLTWSMEFDLVDGKTERLIEICKHAGATHYLSGPSAKSYLDETLFRKEGIVLEYIDYSGYPEYPQLYGRFEHTVTVLDLLLNTGPSAKAFMKSFARTYEMR